MPDFSVFIGTVRICRKKNKRMTTIRILTVFCQMEGDSADFFPIGETLPEIFRFRDMGMEKIGDRPEQYQQVIRRAVGTIGKRGSNAA